MMRKVHTISSLSSQLLILVTSLLWSETIGRPYIALTKSRAQKCVSVPYPSGNKITVHYDFLEYNMREDFLEINIKPKHGDDDLFNDDHDDYGPDDDSTEQKENLQVYKVPKRSGSVNFELNNHGVGNVEVCVNGNREGRNKNIRPTFVALDIKETGTHTQKEMMFKEWGKATEPLSELQEAESKLKSKKLEVALSKGIEDHNKEKASAHFNHLEKQIYTMFREIGYLQNNADAQKKAESKFFQKSVEMQKSAGRWPIVHLFVLIACGYLQARHMMNFFKSRRVM